jgi:hypothetical protein
MQTAAGVALVTIGVALALSLVTWLRGRFGRNAADGVAAASGVLVGVGGLVIVGGANVWSWVVAPLFLATGAVAQRRALQAPGGPFRT